jgi:hypothetical protein
MFNPKVFIDISGSTTDKRGYWAVVAHVVLNNAALKNASLYVFDNTARSISREVLSGLVRSLGEGDRDTRISTIPAYLCEDDAFVIITDGEVDALEVARTDKLLQDMAFRSVDVIFSSTGGEMNLSVAAPFTRNTPDCRIIVNGVETANGNTAQAIDLKPFFNEPAKFLAAFDTLRTTIALQHTGSRNTVFRNALLDLQENLLAHIAAGSGPAAFDPLRASLVAQAYDTSSDQLKAIINAVDTTLGPQVADAINKFLRIVDGKDFSFANLVPTRLARAGQVDDSAVEELVQEDLGSLTFECPISLDDQVPLCLVARGPPVLEGLEKNQLEELFTNPLTLLLKSDLVAKLVARIDHLVGLEAAKELFARGNVVSPFTRREIGSALTFGTGKDHVRATNVALADLFFGNSKLVGQSELWLAVVYFAITRKQPLPYLTENSVFLKAFETHLVHRMRNAQSTLTLSGLPIAPLLKAPMDIAVWYCVASPFLTEAQGEPTNRLRDFNATGPYLLALVELLGYPYKKEETRKWMNRYHAFAWLMGQAKEPQAQWREKLRAQSQNALTLGDGAIVLLDGPATDTSRPRLPDFGISLSELLGLAQLVDITKKTNAIFIPRLPTFVTSPPYAWNYSYPEHGPADVFMPDVSPRTYRPNVIDRESRKHWSECSAARYGPLKKQISLFNYFIRFVQDRNRYPTSQDEFIFFLAQRQAGRLDGPMDTLPSNIRAFVRQLFDIYERVLGSGFSNVTPGTFSSVTETSMPENVRKELDGSNHLL